MEKSREQKEYAQGVQDGLNGFFLEDVLEGVGFTSEQYHKGYVYGSRNRSSKVESLSNDSNSDDSETSSRREEALEAFVSAYNEVEGKFKSDFVNELIKLYEEDGLVLNDSEGLAEKLENLFEHIEDQDSLAYLHLLEEGYTGEDIANTAYLENVGRKYFKNPRKQKSKKVKKVEKRVDEDSGCPIDIWKEVHKNETSLCSLELCRRGEITPDDNARISAEKRLEEILKSRPELKENYGLIRKGTSSKLFMSVKHDPNYDFELARIKKIKEWQEKEQEREEKRVLINKMNSAQYLTNKRLKRTGLSFLFKAAIFFGWAEESDKEFALKKFDEKHKPPQIKY